MESNAIVSWGFRVLTEIDLASPVMLVAVDVHLVDGNYELFRCFHALPSAKNYLGEEVAAVRGVTHAIRGLVQDGATHIGIATNRGLKSFRNELWPSYRTGTNAPQELLAQFSLLEEALTAWGQTLASR